MSGFGKAKLPRRRRSKRAGGSAFRTFTWCVVIVAVLATAAWFSWVYLQMRAVGNHDDAHPADAIAVFGAAQYNGHPSPVYHARLDHAAALYQRQIAPVVVTLGGSSDDRFGATEGSVGRDYLLAQGVPFSDIIAETESVDTEQQAERLAQISRERGFARVVVVSDPTHLFRIAALCQQQGLPVYTSPRSSFGNISHTDETERVLHEVLSYTAMRLHLQISFVHRWLEGKEDL